MFERTRKQLTFFFGGILGIILILVTVVYYLILQHTLQKNEAQALANVKDKMNHQWEHKLEESKRDRREEDSEREREMKEMEWVFLLSDELVVLVTPDGRTYPSLTTYTDMSKQLQQWAQNKEIQSSKGRRYEVSAAGKKEVFLVSTSTLSYSGGTYWMAIDITQDTELLDQIKLLLLAFTIILMTVASGLGYYFSGKAMVPVKKSFQQQVDFTTNASHELRTPLSVIHSSVELIEDCKLLLPEFEQRVLGGLKDEVRRMIRLVDSLLTLARGDMKPAIVKLEAVNLGEICHQIVQGLQPMAQMKGIRLRVIPDHGERELFIQGNADQLRQLLYILLDNAIKYTASGGEVAVTYRTAAHSKAILEVSDSGIGIPKEDIPRIFDRFYRVDKARSREYGGAGLGLSIAADILQAHHASVQVTSEVGKGSRFEIKFVV